MASAQQRASWAQDKKEIQQQYEQAKWNNRYQANMLRRNVINTNLGRGMLRSSVVGGEIGEGMIGINRQMQQAELGYKNALARLRIAQMARSGGRARAQRPNPPAAPTMQSANGPTVQRAIMDRRLYDPNTYEGQSTGLYAGQPKKPAKSQYQLRSREMY
jgi:hypothetical protein